MHAANMLLEAKRWIEATHPAAWKRRGGRDHVWLVPNDEGGWLRPLPFDTPGHQLQIMHVSSAVNPCQRLDP